MLTFIDREAFLEHNLETLRFVLMSPHSQNDLLIGFAAGFLALCIGIAKTQSLGSAGGGSLILGFVAALVGGFGLLEIHAANHLLLLPVISNSSLKIAATYGVVPIAFFLMIVPFTRALFRSAYGTSVGAWVMGVLLAAILIFCASFLYSKPSRPGDLLKEAEQLMDSLPLPEESR